MSALVFRAASRACLLSALLLAGCDSVRNFSLSGARFHQSGEVELDTTAAHRACRQALERMDFVYRSGTPGSHELEMATRVLPGSVAQPYRQRRALVDVSLGSAGGSLIRIGFWEDSEQESPEDATASAGRLIRGGMLYELFWKDLGQIVDAQRQQAGEGGETMPPAGAQEK